MRFPLVKEWLSFIDIAILPQIEIDYIYGILYGCLSKIVYQLTNLRINSTYNNEYLNSKLSVFTETLSYLCIRLSQENLNDLFKLAVQMYKMEAFRKSFSVHDCPGRLFKMVFYSLPQSEIINKLEILLELPIAGEHGFEVNYSSDLAEPFKYIKWSEDAKVDDNFDSSKWFYSIKRLINFVQNANSEVRKRASLRLGKLNDIDGLTPEEQDLFAQALWKNYDPNNSSNNLPQDTAYNVYGFLFLPEPQPGIAKDILSQNIIEFFEFIERFNTKSSVSINDVERYCNDLKESTSPLYRESKYYSKYIDWSSENAEYFLKKINHWWQNNKEDISRIYQEEDNIFRQELIKAIRAVINCLSIVILSRLHNAEEDIKKQAKTLINELEDAGILVLSMLPMTLFIESDNAINDITRKLRFGLSSSNPEAIDDAIIGLQYWLICSQQEQIPEPPPELLNDLVNKVFHRRLPRLNFAIYMLGNIIKKFPSILNENQLETLLFGLKFILQETRLPDNWQDWKLFNEDITTIIEIEDRPEYMRLSAYLALQLYEIHENKETELPQILIDWKEASLNSVFPEVRKVWEGYS